MAGRQQAQAEPASGTEQGLVSPTEFAQLPGEGSQQAAYQQLWAAHAQLSAVYGQLGAAYGQLRQRVEALERHVGLHSRSSGKPPVPEKEPKRKRKRGQRRLSGRRSRSQPGHPGATLRQTEHPDHVETHRPSQCAECGTPLTESDTVGVPLRRQVFDLPAPQPLEATEP